MRINWQPFITVNVCFVFCRGINHFNFMHCKWSSYHAKTIYARLNLYIFSLRDFSNNSFKQASSIAILKTDKRIFSNVNQDKIQVSLQYYRHELMTFQYISIRSFYELLRNLKVLKLFLLHVTPRINLTKMSINSHLYPKNSWWY